MHDTQVVDPKSCPRCGQPMEYGRPARCRVCILEARRAAYRRGKDRPRDTRKAICEAASRGDLAAATRLLQNDPTALESSRALTSAAKHGHPALVEMLLPTDDDEELITRALRAAITPFHSVRKTPGHRAVVELLLSRVPDPSVRERLAASVLCLAAEAGSAEIIEVLLQHGAPVDLFAAAALGRADRVRELLSHDPELARAHDSEGLTALHRCALSALGKTSPKLAASLCEVARLLIAHGAAPCEAVNGSPSIPPGLTPLSAAAGRGGNPTLIELLLAHGTPTSEDLHHALWCALGHFQRHGDGHYEIAEILLAHGADLSATINGRTLLHAFAHHSDARGVEWLLNHGAAVNARSDRGRTPLHEASERNDSPKVAKLLLDHGADANAKDATGTMPLRYAELNGKRKIVDLLQEHGAAG